MGVMKTALTIAGSDSCGGAGIQADIKTMTMNGVYAMSVVTALTAQNTTGVFGIQEVLPEFLEKQIETVVTDIFPDAVKTGMVSSSELIKTIAGCIRKYSLKNVVVDPVMVATSGARLISEEAIETLKKELLPLACVITPNIPEAEVLLEENSNLSQLDSKSLRITSEFEMEEAARKIHEKFGCAVLVKGGHNVNDASDFFYGKDGKGRPIAKWFCGRRIQNPNTHGTGCTLSSAIAANLAKGESLEKAVENAKEYISGALEAMLDLGKGSGPLMHNYKINS
ncbi:bifunctional hydroxymethylpyrimidine kinase/phosphomethylpyrimidine kinase [Treponema sp.]|uniref:bifunctional hydroxymethylpyrimidine kinase/phosphomethylpyrimidine kinase n=1 Tax=Treponema sp. TaxID=166 RepID=UPI00388D118C